MGRKISIISPKAQTTRHRIFSILNDDHYQLVFSDLPGIITPKNKLHKSMMKFVSGSYSDADVILLVIDSSKDDYFDNDLIDKIKSLKIPILIVLNKIDLIDNIILDQIVDKFGSIFKSEFIFPISITNPFNLDNLLDKIIELSPEGNPYFSKDQIRNIKSAYKALYMSDFRLEEAVKAIQDLGDINGELNILVDFLNNTTRGIVRKG